MDGNQKQTPKKAPVYGDREETQYRSTNRKEICAIRDKTVYQLTGPKPSKLDPYKHQIDVWLNEAPYRAAHI